MKAKKRIAPGPTRETPALKAKPKVDPKRLFLVSILVLVIGFSAYLIFQQLKGHPEYQAAERALAKRDFREAGLRLQNYLKERPNDLDALLLAAQTARRQRQFEAARMMLQAYEQRHGNEAARDLENQLLRIQNGDLTGAEAHLEFCFKNPDNPVAAIVLEACIEGYLTALEPAFSQGLTAEGGPAAPFVARVQEAVRLWLEHHPRRADQAQGLVWRGRARALSNDYQNAVADLRAALKLMPDHFEALVQLAISEAQDSPEEAAQQLEKLLAREPENNQVRFALASINRNLGRLEASRKMLDQLVTANVGGAEVLVERGKLAMDMDELPDAEGFLRKGVKLAPSDAKLHLILSQCLRLEGKDSEADVEYESYRTLNANAKQRAGPVTP